MRTNERVVFRLYRMPCCGQLLCWVNPRVPNHCPECGQPVYQKVRGQELVLDPDAILRIENAAARAVSTALVDSSCVRKVRLTFDGREDTAESSHDPFEISLDEHPGVSQVTFWADGKEVGTVYL